MKAIFPVAERISPYMPLTEIIYKCRKCGTSFCVLGHHNKYCFNCGQKQNWNVHTHLKNPFRGTFEEEQELISKINQCIDNYDEEGNLQ